jgi:iron complex outermembrane receptor protein
MRGCWATVLVAVAIFGCVHADEVVDLDDFEVVAAERIGVEDMLLTGIEEVDPTAGNRQASGSIGELLSWEAGVSSSFYGAGASRPIVRGMGGYRVGVYDGGLTSGDLSATSPDHAVAIEPLFIDRIIVHRGAAAFIHGGGAIGGAVDTLPDYLPDRRTEKGWDGEAGFIHESVNEGQTTFLKGGHRGEHLAFRVNLLDRQTNDYSIPGFARTEDYDINNRLRLPPGAQGLVAPNSEGSVPNTWTDTQVSAVGAAWLENNWSAQAAYQNYASRYGVPLDGHTHGNPYGQAGVTGPGPNDGITIDLEQDRFLAQGLLSLEGAWMDSLQVKGVLADFVQKELEGRFLSNDFQLDTEELHIEAGKAMGSARFLTGFEWSEAGFRNRNISYVAGRADEDLLETSSTSLAGFAFAEVEMELLTLRAGGRWDYRKAEREDLVGVGRSDTAGSAIVELSKALGSHWQIHLSFAESARLPNADELYIEAPHGATGVFQLPNPDLEAERVQSFELLLRRTGNRLQLSASAFLRDFDGYIFLENQGFEVDGLTAYSLVQRDARFYGGEVSARWSILLESGANVAIEGFADTVHATDLERGEPLPRIPPLRLGGRIEVEHRMLQGSVELLFADEQDRVPRRVFGTLAYQSPSEAYTLVNLHLQRSFTVGRSVITGALQLSNLFDEEARQHTSFLKDVAPLPGRSLQLSLRVQF